MPNPQSIKISTPLTIFQEYHSSSGTIERKTLDLGHVLHLQPRHVGEDIGQRQLRSSCATAVTSSSLWHLRETSRRRCFCDVHSTSLGTTVPKRVQRVRQQWVQIPVHENAGGVFPRTCNNVTGDIGSSHKYRCSLSHPLSYHSTSWLYSKTEIGRRQAFNMSFI